MKTCAFPPHRLVFKGAVNPVEMLSAFSLGRKGQHFYCPQRARRMDENLGWERFTTPLSTVSVGATKQDVPALIRDGEIAIPDGCMMIAVQSFMGVSAEHPYTTQGYYYISDDGASMGRNDALRAMDELFLNRYGRQVPRDTLYQLCHGDRYVRRLNGMMMVRDVGVRGVLNASQINGTLAASHTTNAAQTANVRQRRILSLGR